MVSMANLLDLVLNASYFKDDIASCRQYLESVINEIKEFNNSDNIMKLELLDDYLKSEFKKGDYVEITEVIKKGRGNCLGLSMLYKIIGDESGLPISLVIMKNVLRQTHCYVLYNDGRVRKPIETQWDWKSICKKYKITREYGYENIKRHFSQPESLGFTVLSDGLEIFNKYLINLVLINHFKKDYSKRRHYLKQLNL